MNTKHPIEDWKDDVVNGNTKLGYDEWLAGMVETDKEVAAAALSRAAQNISEAVDAFYGDEGTAVPMRKQLDDALKIVRTEVGILEGKARENQRQKSFTPLEMEAALCVWEWMLEQNVDMSDTAAVERLKAGLSKSYLELNETWSALGTAGMRELSIHAGRIVLAVHDRMTEAGYEFTAPYDWEFVPAVMMHINWPALCDIHQYGAKRPDPHDIEAIWNEVFDAEHDNVESISPYDKWVRQARYHANRMFGCIDLVNGDPEGATRAFQNGEAPKDYIARIGNKYDLDPVRLA